MVEGYTDVMACHLAGERTAVATCGTAFGEEHVQILRRLLMDQDELRGRVIFTFDGDEAGRNAALKAFAGEQKFVTQTFVAVQPDGLDPCELRQQRGDLAVRDLIASHIPLAEFAIRATLDRYDLTIPEGRVQALAATAPVVAQLKDTSLRDEYARRLAGWLGMEVEPVLRRVRRGADRGVRRAERGAPPVARREARRSVPTRATLASSSSARWPSSSSSARRSPARSSTRSARSASPRRRTPRCARPSPRPAAPRARPAAPTGSRRCRSPRRPTRCVTWSPSWRSSRCSRVEDDDPRYAEALLVRLEEMALTRRIQELKSRLQRLNPVEQAEDYNRMFGELIVLERQKKGLRDTAARRAVTSSTQQPGCPETRVRRLACNRPCRRGRCPIR